MKELATEFEKENPDVKLVFNFGSSGALQQAIENVGGTDLFFSAAQGRPQTISKFG